MGGSLASADYCPLVYYDTSHCTDDLGMTAGSGDSSRCYATSEGATCFKSDCSDGLVLSNLSSEVNCTDGGTVLLDGKTVYCPANVTRYCLSVLESSADCQVEDCKVCTSDKSICLECTDGTIPSE